MFSRAFSDKAACAAEIALEVPARDETGDWGLRGRGGGALSGSELSHLFLISECQRGDMMTAAAAAAAEQTGRPLSGP